MIAHLIHLYATANIQLHFYEELDVLPMDSLFMTASDNPTSSGSSNRTADSAVALVHGPNPDLVVLAGIPSKLQRLAIRTQLSTTYV